MNKKIFIAFAAIILLATLMRGQWGKGQYSSHQKESGLPIRTRSAAVAGILLNDCSDGRLGVAFLCDFAWEKKKIDTDAMFFVFNSEPSVTFKMIKVDADVLFVRQLSRDKLEAIGQYNNGFTTEEAEVAGLKAIKVKAFAKDDQETRLLDYYFVRNKNLYAVMFSVNPKEKWDNYKFVFQRVVNSLQFANKE